MQIELLHIKHCPWYYDDLWCSIIFKWDAQTPIIPRTGRWVTTLGQTGSWKFAKQGNDLITNLSLYIPDLYHYESIYTPAARRKREIRRRLGNRRRKKSWKRVASDRYMCIQVHNEWGTHFQYQPNQKIILEDSDQFVDHDDVLHTVNLLYFIHLFHRPSVKCPTARPQIWSQKVHKLPFPEKVISTYT